MIRPDYRDFRTRSQSFRHSSEGSSWKKHKYIKRVDGTYYYPDSYEGGRHLPDGEKEKSMEDELFEKLKNSSDKDIGIAEEAAKQAVALVETNRNKKTK